MATFIMNLQYLDIQFMTFHNSDLVTLCLRENISSKIFK